MRHGGTPRSTLSVNALCGNHILGRWTGRRGPKVRPPRSPDHMSRDLHGNGPNRNSNNQEQENFSNCTNKWERP